VDIISKFDEDRDEAGKKELKESRQFGYIARSLLTNAPT
jgi:hypothetical protein